MEFATPGVPMRPHSYPSDVCQLSGFVPSTGEIRSIDCPTASFFPANQFPSWFTISTLFEIGGKPPKSCRTSPLFLRAMFEI